MPPSKPTALVALSGATTDYDKLYSYALPPRLEGHIFVGSVVLVPFGRGARAPRVGVVAELGENAEGKALKEILDAAPPEARLTEELLAVVRYLKEATFCTWYEAVRAVLPHGAQYKARRTDDGWVLQAQIRRHTETVYTLAGAAGRDDAEAAGSGAVISPAENGGVAPPGDRANGMPDGSEKIPGGPEPKKPSAKQRLVLDALAGGPLIKSEILARCDVGAGVVATLCKNGYLVESRQDRAVELSDFFVEEDAAPAAKATPAPNALPEGPKLSPAQAEVAGALLAEMESGKAKPALLHGVTGSGKTSVFLHLARQALLRGKTALVLVPEIGLTPQMIAGMRSYFGNAVAVQHSGLSHTERLLQWRAIRRGEARVVVGTRSAVFAPLEDIGLIVVDEEQERSYQSESSPRYDAVEVAKRRAGRHGALLLLASATPSVASYYQAVSGRYGLYTLKERYGKAPLPQVEMVDMHEEMMEGNPRLISRRLAESTREALAAGQQVIYLLNRRGYHRVGLCKSCGEVLKCPDCSVPMVYHRGRNTDFAAGEDESIGEDDFDKKSPALSAEAVLKEEPSEPVPAAASEATDSNESGPLDVMALWKKLAAQTASDGSAAATGGSAFNADSAPAANGNAMGARGASPPPGGRLLCHYCGRSYAPAPAACPTCGGEMRYTGFGTQRLEEELSTLFPDARVLRMDLDSTSRRGAHAGMLRAFGRGEYDILLGTQMVAKGLDFERVGLVGVIGIDSLLFAQGYRAYEQVFSLVTQVVGRSGRHPAAQARQLKNPGDSGAEEPVAPLLPGRALIQSFDPENPVLTLAAAQDYEAFYEQEIGFRRLSLYPPFCSLCVAVFNAPEDEDAGDAARAFAALLANRAAENPGIPLRVLGPAPMAVARVAGSWRWRLTLKCRADAAFRTLLTETAEDWRKAGWAKKAALTFDFNSDG